MATESTGIFTEAGPSSDGASSGEVQNIERTGRSGDFFHRKTGPPAMVDLFNDLG